jgi:hypothetical protein
MMPRKLLKVKMSRRSKTVSVPDAVASLVTQPEPSLLVVKYVENAAHNCAAPSAAVMFANFAKNDGDDPAAHGTFCNATRNRNGWGYFLLMVLLSCSSTLWKMLFVILLLMALFYW